MLTKGNLLWNNAPEGVLSTTVQTRHSQVWFQNLRDSGKRHASPVNISHFSTQLIITFPMPWAISLYSKYFDVALIWKSLNILSRLNLLVYLFYPLSDILPICLLRMTSLLETCWNWFIKLKRKSIKWSFIILFNNLHFTDVNYMVYISLTYFSNLLLYKGMMFASFQHKRIIHSSNEKCNCVASGTQLCSTISSNSLGGNPSSSGDWLPSYPVFSIGL